MRPHDPCLALRMRQSQFVCLEAGCESPFTCPYRVQSALIIKTRSRQARKTTADLIKTRVKVNKGFARDNATEDFPGLSQRGFGARIQRIEAILEFREHLLSAVGG